MKPNQLVKVDLWQHKRESGTFVTNYVSIPLPACFPQQKSADPYESSANDTI